MNEPTQYTQKKQHKASERLPVSLSLSSPGLTALPVPCFAACCMLYYASSAPPSGLSASAGTSPPTYTQARLSFFLSHVSLASFTFPIACPAERSSPSLPLLPR